MVIGENQHAVQETPLETDVLLSHFKFLSKILGFRFYFFLGGGAGEAAAAAAAGGGSGGAVSELGLRPLKMCTV